MSAGGPADLVSPRAARAHVAWRSHHLAGVGLPLVGLESLGQAEVGDLGDAVGAEQDVGRLEVAMNDAGLVGCVHCHDERHHPFRPPARRQRRPFQLVGQATSLEQLEGHIWRGVVFADVVNLQNIRVAQAGHGFGLDLEPGDLDLVGLAPRIIFRATSRFSRRCRAL